MSPESAALLLVDDVEENLVALEASLEPLGHRLVRARSGEEALRHLLREDFAAVILDVQMPGLDGFATAEAIKGRQQTEDVPIIFLTAMSRDEDQRLRGFATGAVDYIYKPVDPGLLRARVGVFVRLYTAERQLRAQLEELSWRTAELARSNADLDQFASVLSHDLLDPVNVIGGYLELLDERLGPSLDAEAREWMDRIVSCASRIHALVADLLEYSRFDGGQQAESPPASSLGDAVADSLENLASVLTNAGSSVVVGRDLPSVRADRSEVCRIFQNLIANSVVHSHRPVRVTISAESRPEGVITTVADDGPGLAADQMERVFGIFERSGVGPTPRTGLGLSICRHIVVRAGGRIWIEPNRGGGLAVRFLLPEQNS